jgi:hypothetical protein
VTTLLGGPSTHPRAPGAVLAEHPLDGAEVVRQIVLGEQIDEQGAAHFGADLVAAEVSVVGRPLVTGFVISSSRVRHVVVGEPLLRRREVTLEKRLGDGRQLVQDLRLVHPRHPTDQ